MKRRRRKPAPQHGARLLQILEANLARVSDAALRERLQRAIEVLRERQKAA